MSKSSIHRQLSTLVLTLCLIVATSFVMNAQMRARSSSDSIYARATNTWFDPLNYQFENCYPKLSAIPPLSTDMPSDIILAYVYLDSIMRNYTNDGTRDRWLRNRTKNDTINLLLKYLYLLKNFDPQRFYQYLHTTSAKYYNSNLNFINGNGTGE